MSGLPGTPRQSKRLLVAAGAVVLLMLGFFAGRFTSPEPSLTEPDTKKSDAEGPGPTSELNGVPVGYAQTEEGAVAAATEFARIMTAASGEKPQYIASLQTLAAPQWRSTASKLAANGHEFFRNRYGSEGSATFSPLRYRVLDFSEEKARIDLWGVLTVSSGAAPLEESWLTGTLDLVWVNNDWRVAAQSSEAGPTPRLFQNEDDLSAEDLAGFRAYDRAPSP